jgi:hypothetical protein
MPSGGARSRSGPAPDPNALRRDRKDDAGWVKLPAAGREGDAPEWPLADPSARELELWEHVWGKPEAIMWEANGGQEVEVAMYVRTLADAESHRATAASRTLVVRMMDSLGISEPGRQRNRWMIVGDEAPVKRKPKGRGSARDRLKVVESGEAS